MKIWSLEDCSIGVEPLDGCDINVFPLNDVCVDLHDPNQCGVEVSSGTCLDLQIYLPGPVGPTGPTGPQGPQGPAGSSQGPYAIEPETISIPLGQLYTVANGTGVITLTLPLISSIIVGNLTQPYVIRNISTSKAIIQPSESDQIEFDTDANLPPNDSFTLLPTSEGWLII